MGETDPCGLVVLAEMSQKMWMAASRDAGTSLQRRERKGQRDGTDRRKDQGPIRASLYSPEQKEQFRKQN